MDAGVLECNRQGLSAVQVCVFSCVCVSFCLCVFVYLSYVSVRVCRCKLFHTMYGFEGNWKELLPKDDEAAKTQAKMFLWLSLYYDFVEPCCGVDEKKASTSTAVQATRKLIDNFGNYLERMLSPSLFASLALSLCHCLLLILCHSFSRCRCAAEEVADRARDQSVHHARQTTDQNADRAR